MERHGTLVLCFFIVNSGAAEIGRPVQKSSFDIQILFPIIPYLTGLNQ